MKINVVFREAFHVASRARMSSSTKELSFCRKPKFAYSYIFATWCCKPLIFQIWIIWSCRIHSLKYLRSLTFRCKDTGIRKAEFVTKTQFLSAHSVQPFNQLYTLYTYKYIWAKRIIINEYKCIPWLYFLSAVVFLAVRTDRISADRSGFLEN